MSGVRAGIRRTRCGGRRGRARPIFSYEIPAPDDLASPPRRQRPRGSNVLPASVDKRGRTHAARISAIVSGAALRWDCLQEAQLGDVIILPEMADFSIFGSKTDPTLAGQAAVLPASDARNSGTRALLEGTRAGLMRLAALPPLVLQQAASRFRAARTTLEIGNGPDEFSNWPDDIQALAAPCMHRGCRSTACPSAASGCTRASTPPRIWRQRDAAVPVHELIPPCAHPCGRGGGRARLAQLPPRLRRVAVPRRGRPSYGL